MPLWLVERVLSLEHCLDDVLVASTVEGWVATKQDVQDHTTTPQIAHVVVTFL